MSKTNRIGPFRSECEPVYCVVCGAKIVRRDKEGPKDYSERKTCTKSTTADKPKEEQCWYIHTKKKAPGNFGTPHRKQKKSEITEEELDQLAAELAEKEALRLKKEEEQAEIDRAVFKKYAEQCKAGPCIRLSKKECKRLEQIYTSKSQITKVLPSYERERPYSGGLVPRNAGSNI